MRNVIVNSHFIVTNGKWIVPHLLSQCFSFSACFAVVNKHAIHIKCQPTKFLFHSFVYSRYRNSCKAKIQCNFKWNLVLHAAKKTPMKTSYELWKETHSWIVWYSYSRWFFFSFNFRAVQRQKCRKTSETKIWRREKRIEKQKKTRKTRPQKETREWQITWNWNINIIMENCSEFKGTLLHHND